MKTLFLVGTCAAVVAASGAALFALAAKADRKKLREDISFLLGRTLSVLEVAGIDHFICFGSLLGAIRDRGVILGDEDGDVCVFEEDSAKIAGLREAFASAGAELKGGGALFRVRDSILPHVYVDLYVLDGRGTGVLGKRLWADRDAGLVMPERLVLPTVALDGPLFGRERARGPAKPLKLLDSIYGDDWMIPKKGDKGLAHRGLASRIWKAASPTLLSARLGLNQILHSD
jgi:hypothetical protein